MENKEDIQKRMLGNIDDSFDKSEGSFFYDATKPMAIELAEQNKVFGEILDKSFADTACDGYLDRKVLEQGLVRKPPTQAMGYVTITGQVGTAIEEGIKVASDTAIYTVLESTTIDATKNANIKAECDDFGTAGNCPMGAIKFFPVTIPGLVAVTNQKKIESGYNGESDEELRQRYFEKVRTPPTSGNKYHYLAWAKEVVGVGDAKVFTLWDKSNGKDGAGTVKVVIIDSHKTGAEQGLIDAVHNHIEANRPIGATVTVISAVEKAINASATLTIDSDNYTMDQVRTNIENSIVAYLKVIAFKNIPASYAKIGSLVLSSDGVLDYSSLTVNGGSANIPMGEEEIAVIGTITV